MKRSKALEALSHQHHQGLFAALHLKRAGRETAVEARQIFLDFYEREGSRHFRAEEELLLPAFARHTNVDDPAIVRVLTEHVDLRRRGQDLERSVDPAARARRAARESHSVRGACALPDDRSGSAGRRARASRCGARTRRGRPRVTVARYLHLLATMTASAYARLRDASAGARSLLAIPDGMGPRASAHLCADAPHRERHGRSHGTLVVGDTRSDRAEDQGR